MGGVRAGYGKREILSPHRTPPSHATLNRFLRKAEKKIIQMFRALSASVAKISGYDESKCPGRFLAMISQLVNQSFRLHPTYPSLPRAQKLCNHRNKMIIVIKELVVRNVY